MTSQNISSATDSTFCILFVTGRLAESSLREVVSGIADRLQFQFEIAVPGIQVAALLHTGLLIRRLHVAPHIDRVILPGWCQGNLDELSAHFGKPFERGPKDLRDLPEYFGLGKRRQVVLDKYSIEIIGEINHATRQPLSSLLEQAHAMARHGADVIDVGCVPGEVSVRVHEIVRALRQEGLRVSIDSFDQAEVEAAVNAGAELILSCNHSNFEWVSKLQTEVVAIPDTPSDLASLDVLIEKLVLERVPFRVDPIIEPIGMGFTASLQRYMSVREKYPDVAMMMGTGNITEMTEVDSAGVSMILAAICEELGIQSVLTTQVINWCRTAVAEFDAARRLVHYAVSAQLIPKHLSSALVMLRDPNWAARTSEALQDLAGALTDSHFRIFAEQGELHLMNNQGYWRGHSPFAVFAEALKTQKNSVSAEHAFYLGYEMARAELALHLGKQYEQDAPMRWGLLGDLNASSTVATHPENP